ncbi:cysteine hydrolase [Alicyclobacillus fastidiosus]|uniref:Cysteine hydrolase n=1 Tax=Alicyclobacillus fastidiosus TaxID=392011 RepID=A0ABY6ZKQ7_9BACL|nr:isochorismatase family cysteine hydrolase [Alicyclobacillus fastidiosus]WAH43173.1 cysteine hydrolase [Alicyclobacillus fastidiosus]GMA65192.1 isochorismatase [Alicyclobacillus fastidiosus]
MPTFDFCGERAALIVIDMQNAFLQEAYSSHVPDARRAVEGINALARTCRDKQIPIIWTTHVLKSDLSNRGLIPHTVAQSLVEDGPGIELYSEMDVSPLDKVIRKTRFSAFWKTDLYDFLQEQERDQLIIVGCVLNVCCETTARDAFQHDIQVFLPKELNKTRDHEDVGFGHYLAEEITAPILTSLGNKFVHLIAVDELMKELSLPRPSLFPENIT